MLSENNKIDQLFERLENQWDINELNENHYDRFLERQSRKKSNKNRWYTLSIAASVLLIVGFFTFFNQNNQNQSKTGSLNFASLETRQTDSIFTVMIKLELEKVKQKKSPQNEKIIADALVQMKELDADYERIKLEFAKNGESKQIIHAMIRNLKTRIAFLENVLEHIENMEKINSTNDENTI